MTGGQAAEARPATVNVTSHASQLEARHVWTDDGGDTHGSLDFGDSWIVFHDPQQVRETAAKLSQMADAMDEEIARQADARLAGAARCPDHRPVLDMDAGWYCAACGAEAPPDAAAPGPAGGAQ